MVKKISWFKALVFSLLLLVLASGYIYIQFFRDISLVIRHNNTPSLQEVIDSSVARMPIMAAVQIVRVDLQKNIRYIAYSSIKNPAVSKLYDGFVGDNISIEVPVFTKNEAQNRRMISIINHEFVCYPFTETISYEFEPKMAAHISTVCATTIPVQRGKFSGFVAVFLSRQPTEIEKDLIKIESAEISARAFVALK